MEWGATLTGRVSASVYRLAIAVDAQLVAAVFIARGVVSSFFDVVLVELELADEKVHNRAQILTHLRTGLPGTECSRGRD